MKKIILLIVCLNASACTVARYNEGNFFVADFHPGGESIAVEAALTQKGVLRVNRTTSDSTPALEAALAPLQVPD